jgi:hypothetical protein
MQKPQISTKLVVILLITLLAGIIGILRDRDFWLDESHTILQATMPYSAWWGNPLLFLASVFCFALIPMVIWDKSDKLKTLGKGFYIAFFCMIGVVSLITSNVLAIDVHPPAYFAIMKLWLGIFGSSVTAARSLSLLFGILAITQIWSFTKRHYGESAAVWATIFISISTTSMHYFTEARAYSLVIFLSVLSFNLYDKMMERKNRLNLPADGLMPWSNLPYWFVLVLLPFCHYYAGFIIIIHVIMHYTKTKKMKETIQGYSPVFFALIPLFWFFLIQKSKVEMMWLPTPGRFSYFSAITFSMFEGKGLAATYAIPYVIFSIIVLAFITLFVYLNREKYGWTHWLIAFVSPIVGILIGLTSSTYHPRYFLMTLWLIPVLVAAVISTIQEKKPTLGYFLGCTIVALLLFSHLGIEDNHELQKAAQIVKDQPDKLPIIHESTFSLLPTMILLPDREQWLYSNLPIGYQHTTGADVMNWTYLTNDTTKLPKEYLYYEASHALPTEGLLLLKDVGGLRVWRTHP